IVVDFLKLPAAKIGQVGAGLDPGPFAPRACVSGAGKIRPRIAPPRASGRRMLLIAPPPSFAGRANVPPEDEGMMSARGWAGFQRVRAPGRGRLPHVLNVDIFRYRYMIRAVARAATTADAFNAVAEPRRRQILD